MHRLVAALVITAAAVGTAWAGDPPAGKDAVDLKLAAKPGDAFRFRQTESSSTEVDGKPYSGEENTQEYTVAVKGPGKDGGLEVAVTLEQWKVRLLDRRSGKWIEFDTSKPDAADAGMQAKMMAAVSRSIIGRPFTVSLDAHGTPLSVTGLREAATAGLEGSPFAGKLPVAKMFDDAQALKLAAPLFVTSPQEAHAVGATWSGDTKESVSSQTLDCAAEWKLDAATADDATVTSKLTWKPGAEATADGAKAAGTGQATAKFGRKDGFVVSSKKHVEANRDTGATKATSHNDHDVERLPAKAAETKPGETPPAKK